jgi:hypothetical protein
MKQISGERIGAKKKRHYDAAKTPFQRLLEQPFENVLEGVYGLNRIPSNSGMQRPLSNNGISWPRRLTIYSTPPMMSLLLPRVAGLWAMVRI